jgi:hypothetical protein
VALIEMLAKDPQKVGVDRFRVGLDGKAPFVYLGFCALCIRVGDEIAPYVETRSRRTRQCLQDVHVPSDVLYGRFVVDGSDLPLTNR